jgi:hypothetical protein
MYVIPILFERFQGLVVNFMVSQGNFRDFDSHSGGTRLAEHLGRIEPCRWFFGQGLLVRGLVGDDHEEWEKVLNRSARGSAESASLTETMG